jgi:hypothetical protein
VKELRSRNGKENGHQNDYTSEEIEIRKIRRKLWIGKVIND